MYRHVPLYLEWAPVNLLTDGFLPAKGGLGMADPSNKALGQDLVKSVEVEQSLVGLPEDDVHSSIAQV